MNRSRYVAYIEGARTCCPKGPGHLTEAEATAHRDEIRAAERRARERFERVVGGACSVQYDFADPKAGTTWH